jgi:exopolysaccharide production protein ExoQ
MTGLATFICISFIIYLFWDELSKTRPERISWIPFAWMFIAGSRFLSRWLNVRAAEGATDADGSSVDRAFFGLLILCGCFVLSKRRVIWSQLLGHNKWLLAYLFYCLLSIFWTDEPYILLKRWIKDLGNPLVVVILLTERYPYEAIATTIRRLSFVFLPLSVLFIKYYPDLGRDFAAGGAPMYPGVGDQKNTLGLFCLLVGIFTMWQWLYARMRPYARMDMARISLIPMFAWLFYMANSQTSLLCLGAAALILIFARLPAVAGRPRVLVGALVCISLAVIVGDTLFSLRGEFFALLGRNSTLTNRTNIWETVSGIETNALIGVGFMSFWSGDRLNQLAVSLGPNGLVNQAHNGYLEQYLNLGYVGVTFIAGIAFLGLLDITRVLRTKYAIGVLRLCLLTSALLYNYTEASFYGINNMWVMFLAASIHLPGTVSADFATYSTTALQRFRRGKPNQPERKRIDITSRPRGLRQPAFGLAPRPSAAPRSGVRRDWNRNGNGMSSRQTPPEIAPQVVRHGFRASDAR